MYGTWRSVRDVVSMERAQQSYFWGDSEIFWSIEVLNASYFFEWSQTWGPFFISNSLLDLPIWFACIFQGALSSLSWTYRVFLLLHFLLLIFFLKMKYKFHSQHKSELDSAEWYIILHSIIPCEPIPDILGTSMLK